MCDLVAGAQAEIFFKGGHLLDLECGQGRKARWSVILRLYAVGKKKILETVGFPCDTTVAGCSFDEVRSLYVIFNVIDILEQVNF